MLIKLGQIRKLVEVVCQVMLQRRCSPLSQDKILRGIVMQRTRLALWSAVDLAAREQAVRSSDHSFKNLYLKYASVTRSPLLFLDSRRLPL
jgi:hypothetical protein